MKKKKNVVVSSKNVLNSIQMDLPSDPIDPQFPNVSDLAPLVYWHCLETFLAVTNWGGGLLMALSG